jgi:hypothetical protein
VAPISIGREILFGMPSPDNSGLGNCSVSWCVRSCLRRLLQIRVAPIKSAEAVIEPITIPAMSAFDTPAPPESCLGEDDGTELEEFEGKEEVCDKSVD